MDLKVAKKSLENEVKDEHTNVQHPLDCKYAIWKIIDYLWACHLEGETEGNSIEWLKELYRNFGMTEENIATFTYELELIIETIRRNPLKKIQYEQKKK